MKFSRIGRNRAPSCFPYAATVAFVSCHRFVKEVSLRLSNGMHVPQRDMFKLARSSKNGKKLEKSQSSLNLQNSSGK